MRTVTSDFYIGIHYTANDGDRAESNGKYFKNNVTNASAHYFVDDTEIVRSVPDNRVAFSVGGKKYNNGGGRLYGKATNYNTINIELCDTIKNGTVSPTIETVNNALELVRSLMNQYGIPKDHVIRHYDVNGKPCPAYWVNDDRWRSEFWERIDEPRQITFTPIQAQDRAVYRLYNRESGEHFFTADAREGDNLQALGWKYEGIAWHFAEGAGTPVYRLYNQYAGDHFFTTNETERVILCNHGWKDEGVAFTAGGSGSVYRLYDNWMRHFFTAGEPEKASLIKAGWKDEGTAWACE